MNGRHRPACPINRAPTPSGARWCCDCDLVTVTLALQDALTPALESAATAINSLVRAIQPTSHAAGYLIVNRRGRNVLVNLK